MTLPAVFAPAFATIAYLLAAMAALAAVETLIPLHARGRWNRAHVVPNLALSFLTFGTNLFLNVAVVALVLWLESRGFGLLRWLSVPPLAAGAIAVAALDFAFYAAHVSWHKIPSLWRFHAVHHSDPAVDVTTTIRQHPVEGLLRYAALAAMAIVIGPSPAAFIVYRAASALNALLEHANLRAPRWLDRGLSLVTTWPYMHKVHHSRRQEQTDTNYGNLFSFWDRLFGTFTPSHEGMHVRYGLEGFDQPALQTTAALLALPFREPHRFAEAPLTIQSPKARRNFLGYMRSFMRWLERSAHEAAPLTTSQVPAVTSPAELVNVHLTTLKMKDTSSVTTPSIAPWLTRVTKRSSSS